MSIEKPERFKAIVKVISGHWGACEICHGGPHHHEGFQGMVNHLLGHGLTLLHVGSQHEFHGEQPTLHTVAVLGSESALPPPPEIIIGGIKVS